MLQTFQTIKAKLAPLLSPVAMLGSYRVFPQELQDWHGDAVTFLVSRHDPLTKEESQIIGAVLTGEIGGRREAQLRSQFTRQLQRRPSSQRFF